MADTSESDRQLGEYLRLFHNAKNKHAKLEQHLRSLGDSMKAVGTALAQSPQSLKQSQWDDTISGPDNDKNPAARLALSDITELPKKLSELQKHAQEMNEYRLKLRTAGIDDMALGNRQ